MWGVVMFRVLVGATVVVGVVGCIILARVVAWLSGSVDGE